MKVSFDTQKYYLREQIFTKQFVIANGLENLFTLLISNQSKVKAIISKTFKGMKKPLIEEGKEYEITSIEPYQNTILIGIKTTNKTRFLLRDEFFQIFEANLKQ